MYIYQQWDLQIHIKYILRTVMERTVWTSNIENNKHIHKKFKLFKSNQITNGCTYLLKNGLTFVLSKKNDQKEHIHKWKPSNNHSSQIQHLKD